MNLKTKLHKRSQSSVDIVITVSKSDLLGYIDDVIKRPRMGRPFSLSAEQFEEFKKDSANGHSIFLKSLS